MQSPFISYSVNYTVFPGAILTVNYLVKNMTYPIP